MFEFVSILLEERSGGTNFVLFICVTGEGTIILA